MRKIGEAGQSYKLPVTRCIGSGAVMYSTMTIVNNKQCIVYLKIAKSADLKSQPPTNTTHTCIITECIIGVSNNLWW